MEPVYEWNDMPRCPYCRAWDNDWWDGLPLKNDGDEATIKCTCGEKYKAIMSVDVQFKSEKIKG